MSETFPEQSLILTSGQRTVQVTRIQADTKRVRLDLCDTPEEGCGERVTFQTYPLNNLAATALIVEWLGPIDPALLAWVGMAASEGYGDYIPLEADF